jgi:hypothetical protein
VETTRGREAVSRPDPASVRARYSGAYLERISGGGDRPEVAYQFTAEDLLATSVLSVQIEGYHALHVLDYQAHDLSNLLTQIPLGIALQDPEAEAGAVGRSAGGRGAIRNQGGIRPDRGDHLPKASLRRS